MFCWRITKYNPKFRSMDGAYLKKEWTSYSDIGKVFEGNKFTFDQYIQAENAYVEAIILVMKCLNLNELCVTKLEKHNKPKKNKFYPSNMIDTYNNIENGQPLTKELIIPLAKLALRENLWCKLASKNMYVHFGYDYYMYIGSKKPCKDIIEKIEKTDLFVETYQSPYSSS